MGAFIRRDDIGQTMQQVYALFPVLHEKRRQPAGERPAGSDGRWPLGSGLETQPQVLMLDEPTAGVSPIVMDELFDRIIEGGEDRHCSADGRTECASGAGDC